MVKPAHDVRVGEVYTAQVGVVVKTVKVLGVAERRVSAAAARNLVEDLTPPEEYAKLREPRMRPLFVRPKGLGRPTKKDRRQLDGLW